MIFQTTLLSCFSCLLFYQISKELLLPCLYHYSHYCFTNNNNNSKNSKNSKNNSKSEQQDSENKFTSYHDQYTEFEKKVNAQKLMSFLHGVISTIGALMCVMSYEFSSHTYALVHIHHHDHHQDEGVMKERMKFLEITLGYFMADLMLYMTDVSKYSKMDIAHHVLSCVAYMIGLLTRFGTGSFAMICFQTNEISTPFYHVRYFLGLSPNYWKRTRWYALNEMMFSVLFFVFRIAYNAFVLWSVWKASVMDFSKHDTIVIGVLVVIGALYYMVQLIWFYRILQIVFWKLSAALSSSNNNNNSKKQSHVNVGDKTHTD